MRQRKEKTVLFLCTGNYYRSRFAEILFNSVVGRMGIPWKAFSRGLALERGVNNVGPMAVTAIEACATRCVGVDCRKRWDQGAKEQLMRRRTVMILVGVLVVGALGASLAGVFKPFEEGPRYKGMPVSYWRKSLLDWKKSQGRPSMPLLRLQTLLGLRSNGGQPAILGSDQAALPMLLQLIRDEDSSVSGQALYTLRNLPATKALWRAIVEMLNDKDRRVHSIAEGLLFSFGYRADREVLSVLGELLQSEESNIRTESLNIVIRLGPDAAPVVPDLAKMLRPEWPLCWYAAVALKSVGPDARSAVPGLINMLNNEDELCRVAAADALRHIDPENRR